MKLLNSLFLLLIHWLVLYFSSVNCEIRSRLLFIRKVNVFQNANPWSFLSAVILIRDPSRLNAPCCKTIANLNF